MKIVITGAGRGIGLAAAREFWGHGHEVIGIDIREAGFSGDGYSHYSRDILREPLPEIKDAEVLINCAGVQNSGEDIDVNLKGAIRVTEKYAFQPMIKSVLFIASASARTGAEFPEYAASKGGVVAYMKNVAMRVAKYGATTNSLSPGGVTTESNARVMNDKQMWRKIMSLTPLKKWATEDEIAQWCYFLTITQKSMTAQDILVDNGEDAKREFVW